MSLLFEETRADLSSSLHGVSQAPFCEISNVNESKQLTTLIPEAQNQFIQFHHVLRLKSKTESDEVEYIGNYKPVSGDLIAITHIRPKSLSELNTLKSTYRVAYVKESRKGCKEFTDTISVLTSKCMKMDIENDSGDNKKLSSRCMKMDVGYDLWNNKELKLYAVYLINMMTWLQKQEEEGISDVEEEEKRNMKEFRNLELQIRFLVLVPPFAT
jgi:senataxin